MAAFSPARIRTLSVMLAGYAAFLQLYATQPLLPLFTDVFHTGRIAVSLTITMAGLGVALAAPFAGTLADRFGRKRVIVCSAFLLALTTLPTATATTLPQLIFWRFLQGVFTPGVFSVTVAYVNDEWPRGETGRGVSAYVSGTVLGGFSSRMISGLVAHHFSWHWVFIVLGGMNLICAVLVWLWMPRDTHFDHRAAVPGSWFAGVLAHLRNPALLATYVVGFCVLFSLVGTFTYITFRLAGPPFGLPTDVLGYIFFAYLIGALLTPLAGRAIDRFGSRITLSAGIGAGVWGIALTLLPNLWAVALGLTICCAGVFAAQSSASGFIGLAARENRALATGLYAAFYHSGGSIGAAVPGFFYALGGWPACAAFIAAVQILTVFIALRFWKDRAWQASS